MDDNLHFSIMEDDLNVFKNGTILANGRPGGRFLVLLRWPHHHVETGGRARCRSLPHRHMKVVALNNTKYVLKVHMASCSHCLIICCKFILICLPGISITHQGSACTQLGPIPPTRVNSHSTSGNTIYHTVKL